MGEPISWERTWARGPGQVFSGSLFADREVGMYVALGFLLEGHFYLCLLE
jgi:hypothetical protein